jgi:hypothetical protein
VDTPACPACTAPGLMLIQKGILRCRYCGSSFNGIPLICPTCGWINNIEAEKCPNCGEALSVIAQVIGRRDSREGLQWRTRVQSQLVEMRAAEEQASQLRMQALHDVDQKREARTAEQKALQSQTDRTLYLIVAISTILIALSIIVVWILLR